MLYLYFRKTEIENPKNIAFITSKDALYTEPVSTWNECIRIDDTVLLPFLTNEKEIGFRADGSSVYCMNILASIKFSLDLIKLNATPMFHTDEWESIDSLIGDRETMQMLKDRLLKTGTDEWSDIMRPYGLRKDVKNYQCTLIGKKAFPEYLHILRGLELLFDEKQLSVQKPYICIRVNTKNLTGIYSEGYEDGVYRLNDGVHVENLLDIPDLDPVPMILVDGEWRQAAEFGIDAEELMLNDMQLWDVYINSRNKNQLRFVGDQWKKTEMLDLNKNQMILKGNGFEKIETGKSYSLPFKNLEDGDHYKQIELENAVVYILIHRNGEIEARTIRHGS